MLPTVFNKLYFVLDNSDIFGGRIVRTDSNNICYYDEPDSCDVLLFRLNANINDHWTAKFNGKNYNITLTNIYTSEYFGVSTTIFKKRFLPT